MPIPATCAILSDHLMSTAPLDASCFLGVASSSTRTERLPFWPSPRQTRKQFPGNLASSPPKNDQQHLMHGVQNSRSLLPDDLCELRMGLPGLDALVPLVAHPQRLRQSISSRVQSYAQSDIKSLRPGAQGWSPISGHQSAGSLALAHFGSDSSDAPNAPGARERAGRKRGVGEGFSHQLGAVATRG